MQELIKWLDSCRLGKGNKYVIFPLSSREARFGMRRKGLRADKVLDKIHRSLVWGCVGLTAYGFYLAGLRVHRYFTVLKPAGEERERLRQLELLAEGQDKTEFLPEPPTASENLNH